MKLTDSHCHLYDARGSTTDALVEAARAAGVHRMISVGCDAATCAAVVEQAARFDDVWATAGLHPHEAVHGVDTIVPFLDEPKVVAVGECGLDYHYDHSPRDVQRTVFAEQIGIANARGLPLVIHTREAWEDTLRILDAEGMPPRTIFHCFTGGPDEATECLGRGAYLSFSGIVTFPAAQDVRAAAALCPLDRMLVETDSPYLAPVPHRGRPNQPAFVRHVVEQLANILVRPVEDIAEATDRNAVIAFGLPPS